LALFGVAERTDIGRARDTAMIRLQGDFNGLFGDLLCLSHSDTGIDEDGTTVELVAGMDVIAFEPDPDETGEPAFLVARGETIPAPPSLEHAGSRWCLRIDERGVRHAAALDDA
jgi:hypothetical protein